MPREAIVKSLLLLFLTINQSKSKSIRCDSDILRYYGLKGLVISMPYQPFIAQIDQNNCPHLDHTCCSPDDFNTIAESWKRISITITNEMTQFYEIIQNANEVQSSLISILPKLLGKSYPSCKQINLSIIKGQMPFDQINFQIRNAIQVMAYLQKGFLCTLCDAESHPNFTFGNEYDRKLIKIDRSVCTNLMHYFKDFLHYKFYYFDPMIINMNAIISCANEEQKIVFNNAYKSDYKVFNDCFNHDLGCDDVCAEYRLGSSGNMFIGNLERYRFTLKELKKVIDTFTGTSLNFINEDIDKNLNREYFSQQEVDAKYSRGNLTSYDLVFMNGGINIFQDALDSEFSYGIVKKTQNEEKKESGAKSSKIDVSDGQVEDKNVDVKVNNDKEDDDRKKSLDKEKVDAKLDELVKAKAAPSLSESSNSNADLMSLEEQFLASLKDTTKSNNDSIN